MADDPGGRDGGRTGEAQAVDASAFKEALARFTTGITVVTCPGPDGEHGLTVNAFASLSLVPPLVLFCIERGGRSHTVLDRSPVFAVNILAEDQQALSRLFSSPARPDGPDAFRPIPHRPGRLGAPLLDGCVAAVECRIVARHPEGDHVIIVGEVDSVEVHPERRPLVYYNRAYRALR